MTEQSTPRLDYISCIQRSIDYIEDNLKAEITLQACARTAGFSPYHYYRVFSAYVGLPVMAYVRKRRLAHALSDLNQGQRVIDIALDFGFGSERAFSRAFKNEYGVSPGKYRRIINVDAIPVKLVLEAFKKNHIDGGVVMEPKIVRQAAIKVVGFEFKATNRNGENNITVPQFWDRYLEQNWRQKLKDNIQPTSAAELGICFPGNIDTEDFSYVIGMKVASFDGVPKEFYRGEIPAGVYAIFTTPPADRQDGKFVKAIQGTWEYIFHSWFPESGYEFDGNVRVDYEYYDEKSADEYGAQIDIYVPVVKRK